MALSQPNAGIEVTSKDFKLGKYWARWFNEIYNQVKGPSNAELLERIEALEANAIALEARIIVLETP